TAEVLLFLVFFFFQAEDGIRDFHVTGVQTCALPICAARSASSTCSIPRLTCGSTTSSQVCSPEAASRWYSFTIASVYSSHVLRSSAGSSRSRSSPSSDGRSSTFLFAASLLELTRVFALDTVSTTAR